MTMAPTCTRCGHKPCPACEDWCDMMLQAVWCSRCDEPLGQLVTYTDGRLPYDEATQRFTPADDGSKAVCHYPTCGHEFVLNLKEHAEGGEPCCDGECDWDMPDEDVQRWCYAQQKK